MTRDPDTAKSINGHARDLNDTVKDNGSQCHRQVRGLNLKLADTTARTTGRRNRQNSTNHPRPGAAMTATRIIPGPGQCDLDRDDEFQTGRT